MPEPKSGVISGKRERRATYMPGIFEPQMRFAGGHAIREKIMLVLRDPYLNPRAKLFYVILADQAPLGNRAQISKRALCSAMGLGRWNISRVIQELTERGLVKAELASRGRNPSVWHLAGAYDPILPPPEHRHRRVRRRLPKR